MKKRLWWRWVAKLGLGLSCLGIGLFFLPAAGPSRAAAANPLLTALQQAVAGYKDSVYTITLQNRIGKQARPAETIQVKSAKGGAVYLKWTGGPHQGREALYKPGWNNNLVWVKDGGVLSFSAASLSPDDPLVKRDYLRTLQFLSLDKLAEAVLSWQNDHQIAAADAPRTLVMTGPADKAIIAFAANGLPQSIEVTDAAGLREKYQLTDLRLNAGLTARDFDPANPAYGFPGYSPAGIFIDPERMNTALTQSWAKIKDYSCVLIKQERIKGKLQEKNTSLLKFRKPGDIYMKWIKEPHLGRELIYRLGKDEKLLVHEGGLLSVATVSLSLDSSLLRADTNHKLTELDIGNTLKMIYDNLYRGLKANEVTLQFKGGSDLGGRLVYTVESRFANAAARRYYSPRTVISHDVITGMPLKVVNYDAAGQLNEDFEWSQIRFNTGLTDRDFDPKNKDYKF
ncbi:MAG: DUF1571 domain-containing protein [Myxococcales bacterium]|nr:DUF1571 domain-containing protein [Myxococcales bacterium]